METNEKEIITSVLSIDVSSEKVMPSKKRKRLTNLQTIVLKLSELAAKEAAKKAHDNHRNKTFQSPHEVDDKKSKLGESFAVQSGCGNDSHSYWPDAQSDNVIAVNKSTSSPLKLSPRKKINEIPLSMQVNIDYKRRLPVTESSTVDETRNGNAIENDYDDTCSVLSGVLEEDICYSCGQATNNSEEWNSVVLCDECNGEYHLSCVGLTELPEGSFVCEKCTKESNHFNSLSFYVSDFFPVKYDHNIKYFIYLVTNIYFCFHNNVRFSSQK